MKEIPVQLKKTVREFISSILDIEEMEMRKSFADDAEFPRELLKRIEWNKQPVEMFSRHLVDRTLAWGHYSQEDHRHPLIEYLKATEQVGGEEHKKQLLEILENLKAGLADETDILPPVKRAFSPTPSSGLLEQLIGQPTLLPVYFFMRGLTISKSVAFVDVNLSSGTGFLVSQSVLITNNHVIPNETTANHAVFRFNYQINADESFGPVKDYRKKENGLFFTDINSDMTLIELGGRPGDEWGYISCKEKASIKVGDRVNIIQHPFGKPKQIAIRNNFVEYVDDNVVQYVTHTERGSSGSPVFNDKWELVALHHAGGNLDEPMTNQIYFRNEGIIFSSILSCIPEKYKSVLL